MSSGAHVTFPGPQCGLLVPTHQLSEVPLYLEGCQWLSRPSGLAFESLKLQLHQ